MNETIRRGTPKCSSASIARGSAASLDVVVKAITSQREAEQNLARQGEPHGSPRSMRGAAMPPSALPAYQ